MTNTTTPELTTQAIVGISVPVVLLIISELMPFVPNRYNGILQTIAIIIKDLYRIYKN
jgi:hypothetical protein